MSKYGAFVKIVERGSFTQAAKDLGYTQSAVSQMVKALEDELSTKLIVRSRKGVSLTPDGEELLPYITNVYNAHRELEEKPREMVGVGSGLVRMGTFSSVSCNWLPELIRDFKEQHPAVSFNLHQGEYTSIAGWIMEGSVDFGFVNPAAVKGLGLTTVELKEDEMLAVVPRGHELVGKESVTLEEVAREPYILLDEGELSEPMELFKEKGIKVNVQYRVLDDYTIMSMIEQGLGIAILPKLVLNRCQYDIEVKRIDPPIVRTIGIAYKDKGILPAASRYFIDFIVGRFGR